MPCASRCVHNDLCLNLKFSLFLKITFNRLSFLCQIFHFTSTLLSWYYFVFKLIYVLALYFCHFPNICKEIMSSDSPGWNFGIGDANKAKRLMDRNEIRRGFIIHFLKLVLQINHNPQNEDQIL